MSNLGSVAKVGGSSTFRLFSIALIYGGLYAVGATSAQAQCNYSLVSGGSYDSAGYYQIRTTNSGCNFTFTGGGCTPSSFTGNSVSVPAFYCSSGNIYAQDFPLANPTPQPPTLTNILLTSLPSPATANAPIPAGVYWYLTNPSTGALLQDGSGNFILSQCNLAPDDPQRTTTINASNMIPCACNAGYVPVPVTGSGSFTARCQTTALPSPEMTGSPKNCTYSASGAFRRLGAKDSGTPPQNATYIARVVDDFTDNMQRCSCVYNNGTNHESPYDDYATISPAIPALGYGAVPIPDRGLTTNLCGCPNFNERMTLSAGKYVCQTNITGARLLPFVDPFNRPLLQIGSALDGNNQGVQPTPSPVSSPIRLRTDQTGIAAGAPYTRRIWKCPPPLVLDAGGTNCITNADAHRFYSGAGGALDPTTFRNLTLDASGTPRTGPGGVPYTINDLTNARLIACLYPSKDGRADCIQTTIAAGTTFDQFYNAAGGTSADAGIVRPNAVYYMDGFGKPVTGFYRTDGNRCEFTTGVGPAQQMALVDTAIAANSVVGIGNGITADCFYVVRVAVQVSCLPPVGGGLNPDRTFTFPAGVTRCDTARDFTYHPDIRDLSLASRASMNASTSRGVFRSKNTATFDFGGITATTQSLTDFQQVLGFCFPWYSLIGGVCSPSPP